MKLKQIFFVFVISSLCSVGSVALYTKLAKNQNAAVDQSFSKLLPVNYAKYLDSDADVPAGPVDFTKAAKAAVPAVVHIKTKTPAKKINSNDPAIDHFLNQLFGADLGATVPEQRASGSGVIINSNGYIITNNHVISDDDGDVADEINITLHNGKTYKAKLVGRNTSTDIAVLKINETNLPYIVCGNSDDIQTGQWVLAVGYPLSLETTVTAGIVSATSRRLGLSSRTIRNNETAKSFIQTDAAINNGNSGGALINTNGELIGINSTILSPTGTYAGYSFAIPVNLVKKAVKDIIQSENVRGNLQLN
jgi:S1-C subfamily serine protease